MAKHKRPRWTKLWYDSYMMEEAVRKGLCPSGEECYFVGYLWVRKGGGWVQQEQLVFHFPRSQGKDEELKQTSQPHQRQE